MVLGVALRFRDPTKVLSRRMVVRSPRTMMGVPLMS